MGGNKCLYCGGATEEGKSKCATHMEAHRLRALYDRIKRVQEGKCERCGHRLLSDADMGRLTCVNCRNRVGKGAMNYGILNV